VFHIVDMQSYMESKLTGLHYSGLKSQFFQKLAVVVCGISIAVALPYLHIGKIMIRVSTVN